MALRPIFSDGLPFRTFLPQQSRPLRLIENYPPAVEKIGADDRQGLLNARIEQNGCQDVSEIIQEEMFWTDY